MFLRSSLNINFFFSRITESLKILQLKQPVTQKQIKNKYRQLAKKYHPDSLNQKTSTKQIQQKFVKITVAYNELKDLDQTILNEEQYDIKIPQADRERAKSQDQINRQQTYEYFNKTGKESKYKPNINPNIIPKLKKPFYRTVPQLFIGTAFVIVLMAQWLHKTKIQTTNIQQKSVQQQEKKLYQNVFRSFNYKKNFSVAQKIEPQSSYNRN